MLFTDMIVSQPTLLDAQEDGKTRVRFKATQANVVNSNVRLYPHNVLNDAVEESNDLIKQSRMVGESPHPKHFAGKDGSVVFDTRIENSVIKIFNQLMDDSGVVYVDAEVLDTAKGKDLKALVDSGVPVGISMRAVGDSKKKQINGVMVDVATKLKIYSYDVVMNPATPGCEVVQVLTDSQMEEVLADDVQLTVPCCPTCSATLTPQDPDGDGDLDFYSCESCKEVWLPSESKSINIYASQSLRKPDDYDWDAASLARQYKAKMNTGGMTDAKLSAEERKKLKDSDFAVPDKRMLPVHDKKHVKMAWDMLNKTEGLTNEEKSQAKKRILSAAKKLGVDTSDWNKAVKDHIQGDEVEMTIEEILKAMKDSPEFAELIKSQATTVAQPALDAIQAQKQAEEQAKALETAKTETKAFVDEKLASMKGKVADEVLTLIADSVQDKTSKETAEAVIDSMINLYSKTSSKAKLDSMGFDGVQTGGGGQVRIQVGNEPKPWSNQVKSILDSFDRVAEEFGHSYDPSIRKVNQKFVDEVINHMEKQIGYEAMKDSAAMVDSVVNNDSVSVTTSQLLNQPTISQAIIIQAFQDVESLQFMTSETFDGSEIRWPVETFTSAATVNPATGLTDILVGEGNGIPESAINLAWLTYNPSWRRNAISLTTDVVKTLQSGPAKYDAISRGLYHIAFDKRRKLDNAAYLEMVMASDEYNPQSVSGEVGVAADYVAGSGNVAYVYKASLGGTAASTRGTNPIVRPRTKTQILPSGQKQNVTSNAVTITVGGSTKTMGYLDATGNIQSGDFAIDFENGIFYFASSAGLNPGAATPVLANMSYSGVTNYDRWSYTVPNGTDADKYYNTLLQQITKTVQTMGSSPRFMKPNLGIMSLNASAYIENAAMWYKLNNPDNGALTPTSNFFGNRSGVNFARINAPWVAGDNRILLTQKGATRYAVETPYQIEGPFPKYDASGNIVDAKVFYGRENSVLATPQTIDSSSAILNPKSRSIKITA